jgi:hypothetical protein
VKVFPQLKKVEHPVAWIQAFTVDVTALGVAVTYPDPDDSLILQVDTPLPPSPALVDTLADYQLEPPHEQPPPSMLARLLRGWGLQKPQGRLLIEVTRESVP